MATYTLSPPGTRRGGTALTRPSRRDLLGAAGFTALAGIAAAAIVRPDAEAAAPAAAQATSHPDAALIALCDRFTDLQRQVDASFAREAPDLTWQEEDTIEEAERVPLWKEQTSIIAAMAEVHATTLDGLRARARAFVAFDQEGQQKGFISHGPRPNAMLLPLLRDLTAGA